MSGFSREFVCASLKSKPLQKKTPRNEAAVQVWLKKNYSLTQMFLSNLSISSFIWVPLSLLKGFQKMKIKGNAKGKVFSSSPPVFKNSTKAKRWHIHYKTQDEKKITSLFQSLSITLLSPFLLISIFSRLSVGKKPVTQDHSCNSLAIKRIKEAMKVWEHWPQDKSYWS